VLLGVYLGWTQAASSIALPQDIGALLYILPKVTGFFIEGSITLIVAGLCVALLGRAIRWYIEHDARLLRNAALIVTIGWSRQIFLSTSDLLVRPEVGYERLIFSIAVGILLGVASVIVIFVVHRSKRGFFEETEEQAEEFGNS
jgi:hypothetical protein